MCSQESCLVLLLFLTGGCGAESGDGENGTESTADDSSAGSDGSTASSGSGDGDGDSTSTSGDGDSTSTSGDGDSTSTSGDGDSSSTSGDGDTGGSSSGCGMALSSGATNTTLNVNGTDRSYVLYVPSGYDPDSPYPLVFAWHGLGGDGELARLYYGIEQAANDTAIFVYPDGLPQASSQNMSGWDLAAGSEDMDLFEELLAEMNARACIDPDRIFSTGHSFGSYMSNALACYYPDVLRAIGGVAGGPSWGTCGNGQVGAWLAHDPGDSVVDFSQGTAARDQYLSRNNCGSTSAATSPSPCVAYEGCDSGYPMHWCDHNDGGGSGHNWPGFAGSGIWDFFASF